MKYLLALSILMSSNCFSYIYAEPTDELSIRMQQQDVEDRLNALESKTQSNDLEQFEKELHDNA